MTPTSLRHANQNTLFQPGDVFVLFGELFGRGYATGLIDEARNAGMTIIGITVGRRDENNQLRSLTDEELREGERTLGGTIINVPLMAGFDMDAPEGRPTPSDMLAELSIDTWQDEKLDWEHLEQCRNSGIERFNSSLARVMEHLNGLIPDGKNVLFAHTMAGGIPKAKVFLVIANRIYKGRGARHMSSQALLDSDLGKLILKNFDEVSANTFAYLLAESRFIRDRVEATGGQVRYTAYGYHGTEILIDGEYRWQSYTNYTQGYAKKRLESIAEEAWATGVNATVFNCPEIRTNSSDVFAGIELSLIPLLAALKRDGMGDFTDAIWRECGALLADNTSVEDLLRIVDEYHLDEAMRPFSNFADWPLPNNALQAEQTIGTSHSVLKLHRDSKHLVSDVLSQHVVAATGSLIFGAISKPAGPVLWLNHDVIARTLKDYISGPVGVPNL